MTLSHQGFICQVRHKRKICHQLHTSFHERQVILKAENGGKKILE